MKTILARIPHRELLVLRRVNSDSIDLPATGRSWSFDGNGGSQSCRSVYDANGGASWIRTVTARRARRDNLFGRSGTLVGRQVVMLSGDPPGWEAMLNKVLGHLGVERGSEVVIVMGNARQYRARDFLG